MASKANNLELENARRALAAAREKMADHIGSPNLTFTGREKNLASPTPQARPKSAAALKKEYGSGREKSVKQVEREVVGDSIMMRGKARALVTAQLNVAQKRQALKLSPTLTVPMARNSRPTNKDGATSFHFKHEAIAKTMHEKTSAGGTKIRKNAARDHSVYLERDSAVAQNESAAYDFGRLAAGNEAVDVLGQAAAGGVYIEREEALAYRENGVPVIYSNISQDDPEERRRFWEKVEKYETEPNPDHLKMITGQAPEFWEAVQNDPRCPEQLALAIKEADPSKPCRVRTDDNEYIRAIMADHGWAPPSPRKSDETAAEKAERKRRDKENSKGAHCEDGRGGRTQTRIVGELPHEVSHKQRDRILRRFTAEFEEKNLPYVAVMHAPDHNNNEKNWHFHLAYYERPCSRFTGDPTDYLAQEPKDNWRARAMHEVKAKALASGALDAFEKEWDFAVPVTHTTKCGHKRTSHPFAQEKDRDCAKGEYPLKLRKLLAELTNDELEIAGAERRVDPRRFEEMGINKEAEDHLGSRSAQMESLGIATPRGVENEHRQWQYTLDGIDRNFKAVERNTLNEERRLRQTLESYALNPADDSEVSKMITIWSQTKAEANEMTSIAAELKEHLERAHSRANKVKETCESHLEAIESGRASKRQSDNKANYRARLNEATDHRSGLRVVMATEFKHERRSREEADRLTQEASQLRKVIDARLKDEMAAMMAVPASTRRKDKEAAAAANDAVPLTLNDETTAEAKPVLDRSQGGDLLKQYEVERFINHLVRNNRRIVKVGSHLIPVNPTDEEKLVIGAVNYAAHQHRLSKLKTAQDERINQLTRHIRGNPQMIKAVPGRAGVSDTRYELMSNDATLQYTFKGFADDPLIKNAIETALDARQTGGGDASPPAPTNNFDRARPASQPPDGTPSMHVTAADNPAQTKAKPASLTVVMRTIDRLAPETIFCVIKDRKPVFNLPEQNLKALGLVDGDLQAEPAQARLRAMYIQQQKREINRLVAFISRSPARAMTTAPTPFSNNQPVVTLARNVPPELRDLSEKYAQHPAAQKRMSDALLEARAALETMEASEPRLGTEITERQRAKPTSGSENHQAPKIAQTTAEPPAAAVERVDTAPEESSVHTTKSTELRAEPHGDGGASSDERDKLEATSPVAPPAENGKAAALVTDPFSRTREKREELERRWNGEEDISSAIKRRPKRDRLNEPKEKQDACAAAPPDPSFQRQSIDERLQSLEERLIRLVEDNGYFIPQASEGLSENDAFLIRDHQKECRAIKRRQDKLVAKTSEFFLAHTAQLADGHSVSYPPRIQDVIKAWPAEPIFAAHLELIKAHSDIIGLQAPMPQRQVEGVPPHGGGEVEM